MYHSRDINDLRADVAANCHVFLDLCRAAGLRVLVTETVRDEEYQAYCYRMGYASTSKPSFHGVKAGLAFDVCKNIKGHEYDDPAFFARCGEIGELVGFEWGGRWKSFPDRPHFQWSQGGKFISNMIRAGKVPPTMPLYKEEIDVSRDELKDVVGEVLREELPAALKEAVKEPVVYTSLEEVPAWARDFVTRAMRTPCVKAPGRMVLRGDEKGRLHLTPDNLMTLQILDNLGMIV